MSHEPRDPADVPQDAAQDVAQDAARPQGLGYPTEELPTYRKVATHPEPEPTRPTAQRPPWPGSGELPVTGAPVAPVAPTVQRPRGPHLPTVLRGIVLLALAAVVVVRRLVDHPNWALVGIGIGIAAGLMFVLAAGVSLIVQRTRTDRDVDRMLSGS